MAEYCSLEDAFRDWVSPVPTGRETALPIGGCSDDKAARAQRRQERRQAKHCKGPVAKYIETQIQPADPDRLVPKMELVEAMVNKGEDYLENPNAQEARAQATRATLEIQPGQTAMMRKKTPAFFGANFDLEEPYATFVANDEDDSIGPDFMTAFKQIGTNKSSTPALTIPSVSNFWKPMTPAGADTAFYQALPAPGGLYPTSMTVEDGASVITNDALQRRLKKIYERLDELEVGRTSESSSSETVLFVLSGVFVLFALDLVSKLGR
jgi:hypothetical protein